MATVTQDSNYTLTVGDNYKNGRSVKEIAKLFRDEVKSEIKAGKLPKGLKLSVRIDRFAGGSSIDVKIKAVPGLIHNVEMLRAQVTGAPPPEVSRYTPQARAVVTRLEALLNEYNWQHMDPMTDYWNVKFYGNVEWDYDLETAKVREALTGTLTPEELMVAARERPWLVEAAA